MLRFSEDWYSGYLAKRPKKKPPAKKKRIIAPATVKIASPHAKALASLAKDPTLEKGKGEHYSQVRYFHYFEQNHPDIYDLLHATPNGGYRTQKTGGEMKAEGQKKGYPDITLDAARQGFHGLRIEMKYGNNGLSEDQKVWRDRLNLQGFKWVLCCSTQEAINITLEYMNIKEVPESECR